MKQQLRRTPPEVDTLLARLDEHGVRFVVTGSSAALLHGASVAPGDLDITTALDRDNLTRLAHALDSIGARPNPTAAPGHWETDETGERTWIETEPTPEELAAREKWRADPRDRASFDLLLESNYGAIDIVPELCGSFEELRRRAVTIEHQGRSVLVQPLDQLLSALTIPRRSKDQERVEQLRALQRQPHIREDVSAFLGRFREAGDSLDIDTIRDCFLETFLSLDPTTAITLEREVMLAALPKRRALFDSIGAGEAKLVEASEAPLDETHTLVRTLWTMQLSPSDGAEHELPLHSTFLLRRTSDGWKIAAYLNHQDIVATIAKIAAEAR
ncbi:MAG: YybH family protein [Gaiellaceae bacterium]